DDFDDFIKSVDQSGAASGTQADASSASAAKAAQVSPPKVPAASSSTAPQAPEEFNEEDLGGQAVLADEIDEVLKNSTKRTEVAEEEPSPKKKSRKKLILLVALLLLLVGAGFGAYLLFFSTPKDQTENQLPVKTAEVSPETLAKVKKMDIRTSGIKYDYVRNKKLGPILVLEGRVTNYFDTPKDYITVEVKLFNSKGAVVKNQKQVCGVVLTALQLSELGQIELTRALSDRIAIMANNVNVIPGTSVPFMLVVIYPPTDVVELEVSVVDVTDPPAAGSRGDN
ncbi:MAG: DUF3426 domain-containing protein, partial [Deltaproteobacteria bacterium]|nr:DUF3426 domain-containing protein [Deltaproteobacteria bacterium]